MTDEEKAIEIADNAKKQTYFDSRCNELAGNKSYEAAMVMAEWKDWQFEKYLKADRKYFYKRYELLKDNERMQNKGEEK